MADEVTATFEDTADHSQELRRDGVNGYRGRRWYLTDTTIVDEAVCALGLPSHGDAWSDAFPDLRVISLQPSNPDPYYHVAVDYETPQRQGGGAPLPTPGLLYTEYRFDQTSDRIAYDLAGRAFPDGQEPTVETFLPRADVVHHRDTPLPLAQLLGVFDAFFPGQGEPEQVTRAVVNASPLVLPRRLGDPDTARTETIGAGKALLVGITSRDEAGVFIARFSFKLSQDWRYPVRAEGPDGQPVTGVALAEIYPEADLSGLWP
ncbi:MAG: hypothetical protein AAGI53_09465 [Planctomycetota bacterium]